ncbi:cytochrome c551 [Bacillus benzoevorans]|uniref:Cytochrome c551 n=1 Tax=Bacillus benzoevorans TaxID=1456 RepID=A0A7X0HQL1_9BACI|nr:cytochrome c [Bacillus benzoevorans]MBB6445125.1 cytochrome c551 [Bacillus benzoevorans]
MKKKLLALLFGTSLVLAACGGGDKDDAAKSEGGTDTTETASAGDAEKVYGQYCAACHNADLSGGVGPELKTVGSRLSKDEIATVLKDGRNAMPGGLIKGEELDAVAEWLAAKK